MHVNTDTAGDGSLSNLSCGFVRHDVGYWDIVTILTSYHVHLPGGVVNAKTLVDGYALEIIGSQMHVHLFLWLMQCLCIMKTWNKNVFGNYNLFRIRSIGFQIKHSQKCNFIRSARRKIRARA